MLMQPDRPAQIPGIFPAFVHKKDTPILSACLFNPATGPVRQRRSRSWCFIMKRTGRIWNRQKLQQQKILLWLPANTGADAMRTIMVSPVPKSSEGPLSGPCHNSKYSAGSAAADYFITGASIHVLNGEVKLSYYNNGSSVYKKIAAMVEDAKKYHFFIIYDCDVQNLSPQIL